MRPLAAITLLLAVSAAGAQAPRAYSYDFRLDPGGKKDQEVIHGTVRVSGSRARVDTDNRDGRDDYLLVADGGRTVYVVHVDKKTYEQHDADEFARIVGTALRAVGPVVKFSVRDVRLDTARLGSGVTVAGRRTERVQMRQHWRTSIRVMGFTKDDMSGSAVSEYWADPSLPLMRNPLLDIISTSLLAMAASDEDFLEQGDAAKAKLFRGSPLRADIRMTTGASEGDDDTRLRYEVTRLTLGAVNEADLDVPKGYKRSSEKSTFRM